MKEEKGICYAFAVWVADRLPVGASGRKKSVHGLFYSQQQKELAICERLYGKGHKNIRYREWRIERIRKILLTAICGSTFAILMFGYSLYTDRAVTGLARPDTANGTASYALTAQLGQTPLGEIAVEIPARKLTDKACEALLDKAVQDLDTVILGDNHSLEEIRSNLSLPDTWCDGFVEITWESSDFETVDTEGNVYNTALQEACVITLTARLCCQQQQRIVSFPIRVLPPDRDQAERLAQELTRLLREESPEESVQEWFSLPDSFEGLPLCWSLSQEPYGLWILLLTIIGCAGIYAGSFQDLQKEEHKRQQQLIQDYPGFLARLTMLAGTGMPIRVIFARLSAEECFGGESKEQDVHSNRKKKVYEELRRTCREMESGVTQKEAIENFGRRCRLASYKKCAALLTQNLYRGSDGLMDALWQEAENACEERLAYARQKGEEAQTKLLLPMMMMLLVVMVLVMVPACFSFAGL